MGECERHRRQALGGRVHDDHRVFFPGLSSSLVPDAAPEIDDLPAVKIRAACATQLAALGEVREECLVDAFEAATDVAVETDAVGCGNSHGSPPSTRGSATLSSAQHVPRRSRI